MLPLKLQLAHYLQKISQHQSKTISEIMEQQDRSTVPAGKSRDEARMYLELLDLLKSERKSKRDMGQTDDAQLNHLLKELTEDTERTEMEEASGSKGLKFYEDLLKTIKPHKMPFIAEFEMEDISRPESKP